LRRKTIFQAAQGDFSYLTVEKPAEGQYKEKGSRFLAGLITAYKLASADALSQRQS
jgi:hypothetical protein